MRLVTYNIRRCLGTDGQSSPKRIADVIAECDADIVALQEVDVGRLRSGNMDQAHEIGTHLGASAIHFHPALQIEDELYGDAILTRASSRLKKVGLLPRGGIFRPAEPRGALWIEVELGGTAIQVVNTHLGLRRRERRAQAEALFSDEWLGHPGCSAPCILAGDLNSLPGGVVYRRCSSVLRDVQAGTRTRPAPTFPSWRPLLRIDHIFVSNDIAIREATVWRSHLARIASDHLPLVAELDVGPARDRLAQ
jgi:endonuclease/exonuclease/phosphatase family metal-dependent hydrolase